MVDTFPVEQVVNNPARSAMNHSDILNTKNIPWADFYDVNHIRDLLADKK